jgi:hypothetical protein
MTSSEYGFYYGEILIIRLLMFLFQKINNFPTGSTSPEELEIPEAWRTYADSSLFLLHDSGQGTRRILAFTSLFMLEVRCYLLRYEEG